MSTHSSTVCALLLLLLVFGLVHGRRATYGKGIPGTFLAETLCACMTGARFEPKSWKFRSFFCVM